MLSDIDLYQRRRKLGWILLFGGWVITILFSMIFNDSSSEAFYVVEAICLVLTIGGSGAGYIVLRKAKQKGAIGPKRERASQLKIKLSIYDADTENEKKKSDQIIERLQPQVDAIKPKKEAVQKKIDECQRYAGLDDKTRVELIFAEDCGRFGEQAAYDQEVADLRKKALGK